jgi:hypothetical protein
MDVVAGGRVRSSFSAAPPRDRGFVNGRAEATAVFVDTAR